MNNLVAPTGEYSITDILDLISLGRAAKGAYENAMADGKIDWRDAPYLIPLTAEINNAITGIKNVPKQFIDLDETERALLKAALGEVVEDDAFQDIFNGLVLITRGVAKYVKRSKEKANKEFLAAQASPLQSKIIRRVTDKL